jgi:tetratricopeptide (TPR) repeat protein
MANRGSIRYSPFASRPGTYMNQNAKQSAAPSLQQILREVEAALRAGDMPRAMGLSERAVASGHEHPNLLTLAAHERLRLNDGEKALVYAQRARDLAPRNADVLNVLGQCLAKAGRAREALRIYDSALRQSPNAAVVHFNKACALEDLSELSRAKNHFERAVALQPKYPEALSHLATLAAQRGDVAQARDYATRALALDARQPSAALALAMADADEKQFDQSTVRLNTLLRDPTLSPVNRAIAQSLIGDCLDGLTRADEAFPAYAQANAILRTHYANAFSATGMETALARLQRLANFFRTYEWQTSAPGKSPINTHVFLVGFPRSGTTLLEQVLASHPQIQTMEERDCLIDAAVEFVAPTDGLEKLATLDDAGLARFRDAYWARVGEAGIAPSKPVFIDKMPLNTVLLCLVAKLFPDAKILFALRDPRDVVLSCFRRRFGMNAQMYEFTSLESTAAYYDAVMELASLYRDKLGLSICDLRHENMVADLEKETRRVSEFLGVEFHSSMLQFAQTARSRSIDTPSAAQVSRGLSRDGIAQWRRYEKELAPTLPRLAPWVAKFGYTEN